MAAMAKERSRSLHNFSLPPRLSWGTQKVLRCAKLKHDGDGVLLPDRKRRCPPSQNTSFRPRRDFVSGESADDQIEAIREKLMLDLRSEVDKMRAAILGNSHVSSPTRLPASEAAAAADSRPWNLRTRRAACKEPAVESNSGGEQMGTTKLPSPPATGAGAGAGGGQRAKFSVVLSRQAIEDDFAEMMGRRPPRKPKKRPRNVQKQLDTLFPGLWLSEITADMYKVNENPESGK